MPAARRPRAVALALVATGAAAQAGAARPAAPPPHAGARPVAITLTLRYEMQCGYPGPGPVYVDFPSAMRLPARLMRAAVLVDGKPAVSVARAGTSRVVIGLAPRPAILCDSVTEGTLTIAFRPAANLGEPALPGRYRILVRRGTTELVVPFSVAR